MRKLLPPLRFVFFPRVFLPRFFTTFGLSYSDGVYQILSLLNFLLIPSSFSMDYFLSRPFFKTAFCTPPLMSLSLTGVKIG